MRKLRQQRGSIVERNERIRELEAALASALRVCDDKDAELARLCCDVMQQDLVLAEAPSSATPSPSRWSSSARTCSPVTASSVYQEQQATIDSLQRATQ